MLSGITAIFDENIQIAAGDGFRMAYQVVPLAFSEHRTIVIPAVAVSLLLHLWAKPPRTPPTSDEMIPVITAKKKLALALCENHVMKVGFGNTARIIIKLVQGDPPDWLRLFPKEKPALQVRILGTEFERAVRRVSGIAATNNGIVRLEFADGKMAVSAKGEENEVMATVDLIDSEGEPNRTALGSSYLLDYLSSKEGVVTLSMTLPEAPVSLQYQGAPRVLIMPMFVQWNGKPSEAEASTQETKSETEETEVAPEEPAAAPKKQRAKQVKSQAA